jgi:hypothetical protein
MCSWQVVVPDAADALAAVALERDGLFAARLELVVDDVEHLQEGHVRVDIVGVVADEFAIGVRAALSPDFEGELHL